MTRPRRCRPAVSDAGSASVWVMAIALGATGLSWAVFLVGLAIVARHQAETAADLAALAGAAAVVAGSSGCAAAARTADDNGARLGACAVAADGTVTVTVRVVVPDALARWVAGDAVASARAGS